MGQGILLSGADDIDFMIHGVFSYELFGQTLWITTSHVCIAIVLLVLFVFIFLANRAIKKGTEVPHSTWYCFRYFGGKYFDLVLQKVSYAGFCQGAYFVQRVFSAVGTAK